MRKPVSVSFHRSIKTFGSIEPVEKFDRKNNQLKNEGVEVPFVHDTNAAGVPLWQVTATYETDGVFGLESETITVKVPMHTAPQIDRHGSRVVFFPDLAENIQARQAGGNSWSFSASGMLIGLDAERGLRDHITTEILSLQAAKAELDALLGAEPKPAAPKPAAPKVEENGKAKAGAAS